MKKVSTAVAKQTRNISRQTLTIGLDLGDRNSWYCVLDETGNIVMEQKISTTPNALQAAFGAMPRSRVALEIGTHSPWLSRLLSELGHEVIVANARKVRLIGESRKKDDRLDAQTLARLAGIDPPVAVSGEAPQRASASGSDDDSSSRQPGTSAHGAGQRGPRAGEELRRAIARLQRAQHESGESRRAKSGVA
ncbi:MAG TPA: transposase, partial [Candidatus Sulfotelmatobacter sp.]|nr:transposase [Candidatus Sulfotelmatobacter sp.]